MNIPLERLMRPGVREILPYSPGKPVEEVEREYGLRGAVKMASNENPSGPSPLAVEALKKASGSVNIYPDGGCYYLKEKMSAFLGTPPGSIIPGNGSDEIIRVITETFLNEGEEAIISRPSFVVYETAVKVMGGKCRFVELNRDFSYDIDGILASVNEKTKLVFFANPNNPTGTIVSKASADYYMKNIPENVITIFDEAYFEYVETGDYPDSLEYISSGAPVITLRTFSKIYGLAGLRIGYGITHPEMVSEMNRVRQPFNVNSLAQAAAMAAVSDGEHLEKSRQLNREGKKYLYRELQGLGIDYVPTEANFILLRVGNAEKACEGLIRQGVIVRGMGCYGLDDFIRVTIGLEDENIKFIESLKRYGED